MHREEGGKKKRFLKWLYVGFNSGLLKLKRSKLRKMLFKRRTRKNHLKEIDRVYVYIFWFIYFDGERIPFGKIRLQRNKNLSRFYLGLLLVARRSYPNIISLFNFVERTAGGNFSFIHAYSSYND